MLTRIALSIREATRADGRNLANLIHFEHHVHRHLDWRPPLDWIGHPPFLVAERDDQLLAALACPPEPEQVAWIRLFAVSASLTPPNAWQALWHEAQNFLAEQRNSITVAAIPMQRWFRNLLEESGFDEEHRVVVLNWDAARNQVAPPEAPFMIRPMNYDDLPAIEVIDSAAFSALWHTPLSCLELAFEQAAIASVVEMDGSLVAYQISTPTPLGGHLARLAVLPEYQGIGVGRALVEDLLWQFYRRGARSVTVNTQDSNLASLSLYQRVGFQLTDEAYPVYRYTLRKIP